MALHDAPCPMSPGPGRSRTDFGSRAATLASFITSQRHTFTVGKARVDERGAKENEKHIAVIAICIRRK